MITGRIYIIYNTVDEQVCIGSTEETIDDRMDIYKKNQHNKHMKICKLMREYGWDKFDIALLEEIECEDKRELYWHEGQWQIMMKDAGYRLTNTKIARGIGNNSTEQYHANPESYEKKKAWSREKIPCPDCGKMITRDHMARHRKYHNDPEYRQKKKARKREKIPCPDCGKMMCRSSIWRHRKSCPVVMRPNFDICLI